MLRVAGDGAGSLQLLRFLKRRRSYDPEKDDRVDSRILTAIADLTILSALWLTCCLPVRAVRKGRGMVSGTFFRAFLDN